MKTSFFRRVAGAGLIALMTVTTSAHAHGGRAGDVEITHPFATPTPPGATNGAAYIVSLENSGKQPDKLLKVSTPIAERAEIHSMGVDAGGVMRMREVDGIDLAPGATVKMKPGDGYHIMLIGLKQPLKDGDSFALTMVFAKGGTTDVKVIVQVPKAHAGSMPGMSMDDHKH